MRKVYFILASVLLLFAEACAQKPAGRSSQAAAADSQAIGVGVEAISRHSVEAQLSFLASDALAGRKAGQAGGRVAAEYIKAVLHELGVKPLYASYLQPFEAYSRKASRGRSAFEVNPDSIAALFGRNAVHRRLSLQNVLGYVEGQRKDEYVVIGAHYDHLGVDELLVGDPVYNGADDNASGVTVALQVAKAVAATGQKPLRSIIFAFWDGEEVGYIGSEYFVAGFAQPSSSIKAYVNLDMVGRQGVLPTFYPHFELPKGWDKPDTVVRNDVYLLHTKELNTFGEQLVKEAAQLELNLTLKPSPLAHKSRGSDNFSFSLRAIPVLWFFTGIHPEYHTPADETAGINLDKLTDIAKATFLSLWKLAN
jgi:hypothetical protein